MAKLCNNESIITYYYIMHFHYNVIITYYYDYYYVFETGQLADVYSTPGARLNKLLYSMVYSMPAI